MTKRKNDVKREGWSAHKLADESSYAIDTKQKLKQGDVDNTAQNTSEEGAMTPQNKPHTSRSKGGAPRKRR